jgi:hypothetical protein
LPCETAAASTDRSSEPISGPAGEGLLAPGPTLAAGAFSTGGAVEGMKDRACAGIGTLKARSRSRRAPAGSTTCEGTLRRSVTNLGVIGTTGPRGARDDGRRGIASRRRCRRPKNHLPGREPVLPIPPRRRLVRRRGFDCCHVRGIAA